MRMFNVQCSNSKTGVKVLVRANDGKVAEFGYLQAIDEAKQQNEKWAEENCNYTVVDVPEVYLHLGKAPSPCRTVKVEHERTETMPVNRSVSGYGSKLPTSYMIKFRNRWRRVYAICWSNCATHYIKVDGQTSVVTFYGEFN